MAHWQHTPSSPTTVDDLHYDGEGTRIEQRTVQGSTTTTTYYLLGGQEEVQIVSGGATTLTKYYPTGATGLPQPMKVGTTISYLATDGLDTVSEAVDSGGTVTAQQLYLPYGGSRYSNGTMPTSKGYTGQRADAATGLDYYGARYYDPLVAQFTSADDVLPGDGLDPWGLSRYAYVEGNPIARNDPSGHCWPVCAIVAAVAVGVAAAVVDVAVQAVQNHGDLSKTNWGQVATVGVAAGVVTGAVLLAGPAALEAVGAETFASTGADVVGNFMAAKTESAVTGAISGGILGASEGVMQGIQSGHSGMALFRDAAIAGGAGAAGGFIGGYIGNPVLAGAVSNGMANFMGQALGASGSKDPVYFDSGSFGLALGAGATQGYYNAMMPPINTLPRALGFISEVSILGVGVDYGSQYYYYHSDMYYMSHGTYPPIDDVPNGSGRGGMR